MPISYCLFLYFPKLIAKPYFYSHLYLIIRLSDYGIEMGETSDFADAPSKRQNEQQEVESIQNWKIGSSKKSWKGNSNEWSEDLFFPKSKRKTFFLFFFVPFESWLSALTIRGFDTRSCSSPHSRCFTTTASRKKRNPSSSSGVSGHQVEDEKRNGNKSLRLIWWSKWSRIL